MHPCGQYNSNITMYRELKTILATLHNDKKKSRERNKNMLIFIRHLRTCEYPQLRATKGRLTCLSGKYSHAHKHKQAAQVAKPKGSNQGPISGYCGEEAASPLSNQWIGYENSFK